eukprot:SAG31_NODE_1279_length_9036_cov_1.858454_2_plen_116_part_00
MYDRTPVPGRARPSIPWYPWIVDQQPAGIRDQAAGGGAAWHTYQGMVANCAAMLAAVTCHCSWYPHDTRISSRVERINRRRRAPARGGMAHHDTNAQLSCRREPEMIAGMMMATI